MEILHNSTREIPYGKNILINCPICGFKGEPSKYRKGNTFLEIILWFLLLIPGVIYTARRHINTFCLCPKCKQHYLLETDGNYNLINALCKIRRKQLCWFWAIVVVFSILGLGTIFYTIKHTVNKTYNETILTINSINNLSNTVNEVKEIYGSIDIEEPINNLTDPDQYKQRLDSIPVSSNNTEDVNIGENKIKDTDEEIRGKMQNILKQIDYQYGEDMWTKVDSYIGASCSGDCINGIININFSENIGWYDFTVKAHSSDWSNKIIKEIPGVFEEIQINFICKGQTICSCTFTEYQTNSYIPKGCTYYGYSN